MNDVYGYLETMRLLPRSQSAVTTLGITAAGQKKQQLKPGDGQGYSVSITLVSLGLMYSVHNLIAPNMTAMAKVFHFNAYERDAYLGGELTLFFYFPGVFGALLAGVLSGMFERRILLAMLAILTSLSCIFTARVSSFQGLAWARALTGFAIGGSLPVVYSLVGDWFPAGRRASATAFVTAASGVGVFLGQCIATLFGSVDWQLPFLVVALPTALSGIVIFQLASEPVRGGQEDTVDSTALYQRSGSSHMFSGRTLRQLMQNKTNLLVILQAFPGNIPWGVIIVYLHDFLVQDLGMSMRSALGAITILAASAFAGVILGGFIGEALYKTSSKHLAIFGGVCNIARAIPFYIIFGWEKYVGTLDKSSETLFFSVLMIGGFVATMASPCTGAMLLNVNLPQTRGSIMALYSVLDDLSKGFGTLFVSMIVRIVGGRAVAYQISLLLWIITGICLFFTACTYDEDEEQMRKNLDEAAMEAMVLHSRQRAQEAIRVRAKAAGEAHAALSSAKAASSAHRLPKKLLGRTPPEPTLGSSSEDAAVGRTDVEDVRGSSDACTTEPRAPSASKPSQPLLLSGVGRSYGDREKLQRATQAAAAAMVAARKV